MINITGYNFLHRPKFHITIRVAEYDSPELEQPFGGAARDEAKARCVGGIWIKPCGASFDRVVANVDAGGDLAERMIKKGFGHPSRISDGKRKKYLHKLARKAIAKRRGLWADDVVVLPAHFRKDKNAKGKPRDEYLRDYR